MEQYMVLCKHYNEVCVGGGVQEQGWWVTSGLVGEN